MAATVDKDSEKETKYVNPDKDKTCSHCKKKGHTEKKCRKKHPELIPNKVKAARKKQAEKKALLARTQGSKSVSCEMAQKMRLISS